MEEFIIEHEGRLLVIDSIAVFARVEYGHKQTAERQLLLGRKASCNTQATLSLGRNCLHHLA